MKKIVYILSDNRSGSTLLDQLLGAHNQIISLGEVHHLRAYALQNRLLYNPVHPLNCSCGVPIHRCPFWSKVERKLGRSFASLKLKLRYFDQPENAPENRKSFGSKARRFVRRYPRHFPGLMASMIFGSGRVGSDSFELFNAALDESDARYLIDSSKDPFRFRALYDFEPERMVGIMLGRDYRGTVHSKMKRGRDLRTSTKTWAVRMTQMRVLTDSVPPDRLIRVRYEDLCRDPRFELDRLCKFLRIPFSDVLLTRPSTGVHHLGGSPSKFDPARKEIILDESYLDAFSETDFAVMRDIAADVATEWGYD